MNDIASKKDAHFLLRHWPSVALVVIILALILTPHALERIFVYFPSREVERDPGDRGLDFEDVLIDTSDGLCLHGWFLPQDGSGCTLLVFHGNAGNIGHRVEWLEMLLRAGCNILIIDYRGYGRSEGKPHEKGLYEDAQAAFLWFKRERPPDERLYLLGESLGGAVAIDLATRVPVAGIILQSTFTSAWDMAKRMMPIGLLQPLSGISFDSAGKISGLACSKLFIHGDRDEIVPMQLGRRLFEVAPAPKDWMTVPGAGHNDLPWVAGEEYVVRIGGFMQEERNRKE